MAAGAWFDWTTGDLVTEARFQDIQDSIVFIYDDETAANAALTNKVEGTIFYDKSVSQLKAWSGSAWIGAEAGDIEGVTAGNGLSGGGTSGTVTLNVDINSESTATLAGGDEILIADVDDANNIKKTTAQDIANLASAGVSLGLVLALS
jgi:hypothetical protein